MKIFIVVVTNYIPGIEDDGYEDVDYAVAFTTKEGAEEYIASHKANPSPMSDQDYELFESELNPK